MADQDSRVFRREALERISSPEHLTDYLRVTNPGVWVVLATAIVLLAGIFAWSTTGTLETLARGTAVVTGGHAEIIMEDAAGDVQPGMAVRLDGEEYRISSVDADEFGRKAAYASVQVPDGTYEAQVVVESVHPIQFLLS